MLEFIATLLVETIKRATLQLARMGERFETGP
jgi:hypothetical protein